MNMLWEGGREGSADDSTKVTASALGRKTRRLPGLGRWGGTTPGSSKSQCGKIPSSVLAALHARTHGGPPASALGSEPLLGLLFPSD